MRWLGLAMGLRGTLQYTVGTELCVRCDSSVGIATCCRLDSLDTKSQWRGVRLSTRTLGPTQPL
jgi:hypothetical protein